MRAAGAAAQDAALTPASIAACDAAARGRLHVGGS